MASLDHLNFTVKNFAESAKWYGKIFGFEVVERGIRYGHPWGVLKSGDFMFCISERPDRGEREDRETEHMIYHFGLRIRDRKKWESIVSKEKIPVLYGGVVAYPYSHSWYIRDPNGYEIEVVHWNDDTVRF